MRALLASLLCFVFLQAQVFALHGGPGAGSTAAVVGTYGGLLIPTSDTPVTSGTTTTTTTTTSSNSLGLFTLSVPQTGLATGTLQIFSSGRTFTGTITGIGDPTKLEIRGILDASFTYSLTLVTSGTSSTVTTVSVTASAKGTIDAFVATGATEATAAISSLTGTANLDIDQGLVNSDGTPVITEKLTFDVDGIKQSETASTTTITAGG